MLNQIKPPPPHNIQFQILAPAWCCHDVEMWSWSLTMCNMVWIGYSSISKYHQTKLDIFTLNVHKNSMVKVSVLPNDWPSTNHYIKQMIKSIKTQMSSIVAKYWLLKWSHMLIINSYLITIILQIANSTLFHEKIQFWLMAFSVNNITALAIRQNIIKIHNYVQVDYSNKIWNSHHC